MCVLNGHKWPHGFDIEAISQATRLIHDITAKHVRDAHAQGISPEERIRKVTAVPG